MKSAETKSVNMTYKALLSYVLNTNYRSAAGILGIIISVASLVLAITCWSGIDTSRKIMLIFVGLIFTVINPLSLAFKSFRQLKLSPSYKTPLNYTFGDDGIYITQGEQSENLTWDRICRLLMTKHMIAIYTGRMNAFVIPLTELGDDKSKILTSLVQFTAEYKPRLSRNLKRFESGKGI